MRSRNWHISLASFIFSLAGTGIAFADDQAQFSSGQEALRRGNFSQAAQLFTAELQSPNRPLEQRARAFYFRAKAYAALKQPGLARADISVAVWLGKLSPSEAADASRLKSLLEAAPPVATEVLAVAPVPSKPLAPVKAAPNVTKPAAPKRETASFSTSVAASPPPSPSDVGSQKSTVPAWTDTSVAREAPAAARPAPYVRPSPAFAAAAAALPQQPATAPSSNVETGSIGPPQEASPTANPPAAQKRWQTNVAAGPAPLTNIGSPYAPSQSAAPTAQPQPAQPVTTIAAAPSAPQRVEPAASPVYSLAEEPKHDGGNQQADAAASPDETTSKVPLVGWLFEKPLSPYDDDIAKADALQRRYTEKIRQYNQGMRQRDASAAGTQQ